MLGRRRMRWSGVAVAAAMGLCAVSAGAQSAPGAAAAAKPAGEAGAAAPARAPLAESLTGMAKAEHGAGVALFQEGDYAGAMARFEEAYRLSRDHRLLWNIALCQKNLRQYAALLGTMRRLEQEAGAALTAEEQKDIVDLRQTAEALVSRVEIAASEGGATVLVDGVAMGTTPLAEPLVVDIGERKVRITKPGFQEFARTLRVEGGGRIGLAAVLEKEARRGRLVVQAGPEDLIAVDGRLMGKGRWEGAVPSGPHALRVSGPKMEAHQAEVLVRDGESRRVEVALNPAAKPGAGRVWLWVAGGAALLAGAAVAGAVLFEPGRPAEQGTLGSFPLSFGGRR